MHFNQLSEKQPVSTYKLQQKTNPLPEKKNVFVLKICLVLAVNRRRRRNQPDSKDDTRETPVKQVRTYPIMFAF